VIVPEPDLEINDTDISFSHTGAWINTRGDSQRVTITAKIRNNGGAADSSGATTTDIEVKFYVDGSQLGSVQTIDSLSYGDEATISVYWNPARAHDGDEVGIPIKVVVDPSDNIEETDQTNNEGSTTFKVTRTKASNPSFYMGFLSLTAAVGAAVLLSTYYRNKDLED
jgi:subtilase family serine protease